MLLLAGIRTEGLSCFVPTEFNEGTVTPIAACTLSWCWLYRVLYGPSRLKPKLYPVTCT